MYIHTQTHMHTKSRATFTFNFACARALALARACSFDVVICACARARANSKRGQLACAAQHTRHNSMIVIYLYMHTLHSPYGAVYSMYIHVSLIICICTECSTCAHITQTLMMMVQLHIYTSRSLRYTHLRAMYMLFYVAATAHRAPCRDL